MNAQVGKGANVKDPDAYGLHIWVEYTSTSTGIPSKGVLDFHLRLVDCANPTKEASIGDKVWEDKNENGIQDGSEPGVRDVEVKLLKNGSVIDTTKTRSNGTYAFNYLAPGDYQVCFTLPNGFEFTAKDQGSDDSKDSDADESSGCTDVTSFTGRRT